jgi:hypothetical protein
MAGSSQVKPDQGELGTDFSPFGAVGTARPGSAGSALIRPRRRPAPAWVAGSAP